VAEAAPVAAPQRRRWWPGSLGGRTAVALIVALMLVQAAGLTIHALDRVDLQRFVQAREIAGRSLGAWRAAVLTAPDRRAQIIADLDLPEGLTVDLDLAPIVRVGAPPVSPHILRICWRPARQGCARAKSALRNWGRRASPRRFGCRMGLGLTSGRPCPRRGPGIRILSLLPFLA
jgi:hypothetical protein